MIVGASAALVILLGGRTSGHVAGIWISLKSAVGVGLATAALAGLRAVVGGRTRPLPAAGPAERGSIDAERLRFARGAPLGPAVWLYGLAALLGSLLWILPALLHPRSVPDIGDPLFSAWRVARVVHQLVADPRHLFDGNTFYPLPLSLTFSDSTLLEALFGAPFLLAGADPLIVANLLTLVAFPACALATFYAVWRLTADPRAALVSALLAAYYPFHGEHYSHLELQWLMFVPLALIAGLRMLAAPSWRAGLVFGALVAAQWLASMYVGVMLMSFLVPFLILVAVAWRVRWSGQLAGAGMAAAAVLIPALLLLGIPYLKGRAIHGERGLQEVMEGSADPADYGRPHARLASYQWISRANNRAERALLPGISTVALAAIGIAPPLTAAGIATLVSGAAAFDWSLGLKGLTYDDLYKRSAAYRGMRVPARFSAIVGCALVLLAGFGAARVIRLGHAPIAQATICAALSLVVLFDLRMDPGVRPLAPTIPGIYSSVTPDMVLAELPRDHEITYMYFSTAHWAHLLGGYSGYMVLTPGLNEAEDAFPSRASIQALKHLGATHLTYNCALELTRAHCERVLEALDANPDLGPIATQMWEHAEVRLYRIK